MVISVGVGRGLFARGALGRFRTYWKTASQKKLTLEFGLFDLGTFIGTFIVGWVHHDRKRKAEKEARSKEIYNQAYAEEMEKLMAEREKAKRRIMEDQ